MSGAPAGGSPRERTALAWNRTGLSLVGGAAALLALGALPVLDEVVVAVVAAVGALSVRAGRRRAVDSLETLRPQAALHAAVAGAVCLLALAELGLVLNAS
jgi:uncharacterized membrane protein YidH (DUF202 family)